MEQTERKLTLEELDKVYEKISNMLRRASSTTFEAEREVAMKKAQKMMVEYSISMSELEERTGVKKAKEAVEVPVEILKKKTMWYVLDLYTRLAPHFRCKAFRYLGMGTNGTVGMVGLKDDVKIATEIIKFAMLSLEYFAECHVVNLVNKYNNMPINERPPIYQRFVKKSDFVGEYNDYIRGYISGLNDAFAKQEEENKQQWGLVLVMDNAVTEKIENMGFKKGRSRKGVASSGDSSHFGKGKNDGSKYTHKKGMLS